MDNNVQQNSWKAWLLASRPKTLTAAFIPVVIATALAYSDGCFKLIPALLCLCFAGFMQIAANFINDLFDYLRGTDCEDRLGPERACSQGWITPKAMKVGVGLTVMVACMVGCLLLFYGGWWLISVGVLCVCFAFLYTTLLSYCGLGDLLVLVFFGLVPVAGTYYVQASALTPSVWMTSIACGLVIDTLLVVNNYRDRDTDKRVGKRTLIVFLGERFGRYLYVSVGLLACCCCALLAFEGRFFAAFLPFLYLVPHMFTWRRMVQIFSGKALNGILGETSRNMLFFGILLSLGLLLS